MDEISSDIKQRLPVMAENTCYTKDMKKRVLSGIKPTGQVQLGNYLGAMRRWASEQENRENLYFVPNLHALTIRPNPDELMQQSRAAVAWLLAMGVDPDKYDSIIFMQSKVPAHSELTWILNNYVTMGELSRMTQFKDKSQKLGPEGQVVGLFDYPVLMACDILLYDADEVPVGEDQKQHIELTRDIASRFNNLYGATFKLPEPTLPVLGARIMDLQYPDRKMSKSDEDTSGCIFLTDTVDEITTKLKRAVTDSGKSIQASDDKPALTNLLQIYALLEGSTIEVVEGEHIGRSYGEFKTDLADLAVNTIKPLQDKFNKLMSEGDEISSVIEQGSAKANELAEKKLMEVKSKLGLL